MTSLLLLLPVASAAVLLRLGSGAGRGSAARRLAALRRAPARGWQTAASPHAPPGPPGRVGPGRRAGPWAVALTGRLPSGAAAPERPPVNRDDVADLTGRLAALARAGVPTPRAWQLLASGTGPGADLAAVVTGMVASGGSVGDGLRLAAEGRAGPGGAADAVRWLAIASDVMDRSGAPSAVVYDGLAAGVLAELSRADEQEVALAGPRLTATMLSALPLAGAGLGLLMGANVPAALLTTPAGRLCLVAGGAVWLGGRWWSRRLVAGAARAG